MRKIVQLVLLVVLLVSFTALFSKDVNKIVLDVNPNPVKDFTTIFVTVDKVMDVNIVITSDKGVVLRTIFNGTIDAGESSFEWDRNDYSGNRLPEGKYIVELVSAAKYTSVKKIIILK